MRSLKVIIILCTLLSFRSVFADVLYHEIQNMCKVELKAIVEEFRNQPEVKKVLRDRINLLAMAENLSSFRARVETNLQTSIVADSELANRIAAMTAPGNHISFGDEEVTFIKGIKLEEGFIIDSAEKDQGGDIILEVRAKVRGKNQNHYEAAQKVRLTTYEEYGDLVIIYEDDIKYKATHRYDTIPFKSTYSVHGDISPEKISSFEAEAHENEKVYLETLAKYKEKNASANCQRFVSSDAIDQRIVDVNRDNNGQSKSGFLPILRSISHGAGSDQTIDSN